MSKKALLALVNAAAIMKAAGVEVNPLVEFLNDGKSRRGYDKKLLWRNSELLASLIVNSAANAFRTETAETLKENGYDNMADAVHGYIASNLDDWSQSEWQDCSGNGLKENMDRLVEMVNAHIEHMKREALKEGADEHESAVICNLCASLIANDDATGFDYSEDKNREGNAYKGIAAWRKEWVTLAVEMDEADNDVSFSCECCGARVHGWRGRVILANFRN